MRKRRKLTIAVLLLAAVLFSPQGWTFVVTMAPPDGETLYYRYDGRNRTFVPHS